MRSKSSPAFRCPIFDDRIWQTRHFGIRPDDDPIVIYRAQIIAEKHPCT